MMKISTKKSTLLSMLLSVTFMMMIIVCAVFVPSMIPVIIHVLKTISNHTMIGSINPLFVTCGAYFILLMAAVIDTLLFILLLRIRHNKIFTDESVALIRGISWCCILLGLFFVAIGYFFATSVFIGFMVGFVGLCIRVVKNAIEEATIIKSENDFTV
jgi:hypothetical protein